MKECSLFQIKTPLEASKLTGTIEFEMPNNDLYSFAGSYNEKSLISVDSILPRGAILKNTNWIYGLVLYTGHETKLLLNSRRAPIKRTRLEKTTNTQIVFLLIILLIMAFGSSMGDVMSQYYAKPLHLYLELPKYHASDMLFKFCTFIILLNNLVPISLIVTMEFVKFYLAVLISSDLKMYNEQTDQPAQTRTSTLVEELGQVQYVFTDKTGTLTCNHMRFIRCIVGGIEYSIDDATLEKTDLTKEELYFRYTLAICNTVIPENDGNGIKYQGSSPDEVALTKAASSFFGYSLITRKPRSVSVQAAGEIKEIQLLNILEFSSDRKRMSAIFRIDDKIVLLCKGADNVIFERLATNKYADETLKVLEECAAEGLRTLCIAYREVPEDEYALFAEEYNAAANSVNRSQNIQMVSETIETKLNLIGATAIEDKLQDGVPQTIESLIQAGIRIWVLTGDRRETAINIGYSSRLIDPEMSVIDLQSTDEKQILNAVHDKFDYNLENSALVVEGYTLKWILARKEVLSEFRKLAMHAKVVICCRVSPSQKSKVVKMIKGSGAITLAIGDGANDVAMIQTAHIGIGIQGVEGTQASRSADFSISQFRYLARLLLVHGAWSYQRLSKLVLYSFYKNIVLYVTQFWVKVFYFSLL